MEHKIAKFKFHPSYNRYNKLKSWNSIGGGNNGTN